MTNKGVRLSAGCILPHNALHASTLCYGNLSVRLSVRLSVHLSHSRSVSSSQTVKHIREQRTSIVVH